MPDLKHPPVRFGGRNKTLSSSKIGGNRLFDENVDTHFEQFAAYVRVRTGRYRHNCRIHDARKLPHGWDRTAAVPSCSFGSPLQIGVDDGNQVGCKRLVKHTKVVRAERTGADYSNSNFVQMELLWSW